ncbi:MAG: penicillin-binding protein activator [Steroidobacteraceae bacterium]
MLHATLRHGQEALTALLLSLLFAVAPWPSAHAQDAAVAQAEALAASGRHLEAAARYEQAARRGLLNWDARLALLAAGEYLAAGERAEATRIADKARSRVRSDEERALLAVVDSGLALDAGDAAAALAAARAAPLSVPNGLAATVLGARGRAEIAGGDPLAGIRRYERRDALLPYGASRGSNDRELFDQLVLHPPGPGAVAPGTSASEAGWLELPSLMGALGAGTSVDPLAARQVRDWAARHPGHPGAAFLPRSAAAAMTLPTPAADAPIALLLPLAGKQQAAAEAVRDGFFAAWFASGPAELRPRLEVYDTTTGAGPAYARAMADGARVVVGPLLKEDVAAVLAANAAGLPVPTLALNAAVAEGAAAPPFLYQYSLDPEEEARAVARRIVEDGLVRGVALFPAGAWGQRVQAAFVEELARAGSVALMSAPQSYDPGTKDFSGPLRAALGRYGGAGDRSASSHAASARDAAAEQASGPQFAFIAATPAVARAIRPHLRFQMTYDLPVYATSDAWDPGVRAAADMEGMVFPELPWVLDGGQGAPELWAALHEEWRARARGRLRLFAFGFDAFRLAQQLESGGSVAGVQGLTGTLEVRRDQSRVQRGLQFARIEGGRPVPAGAGLPHAIPAEPATNPAGTISGR